MNTPVVIAGAVAKGSNLTDASKGKVSNERIRALIAAVRGPAVLHVGCVGHKVPKTAAEMEHFFHYQLCRALPHAKILGIDIDPIGVSRMREMGYETEIGDAQNLHFNACFDTVVAGELIEHLQNPGEFLGGAARALKPSGTLVLSTPNVFSTMLNVMYWKNSDKAFNREHAVWFCPQTLRELLRRYGFRVNTIEFVDDLEPSVVSSLPYRTFAHAWSAFRWLFPKRFRNTFVVTAQLDAPEEL